MADFTGAVSMRILIVSLVVCRLGWSHFTVSPLEKLFRLEIEFQRRLRTAAAGTADASSLHTSFALQTGYEQLIRATDAVTPQQIESLRERFVHAGDARDLLAARDSLKAILGIRLLDA